MLFLTLSVFDQHVYLCIFGESQKYNKFSLIKDEFVKEDEIDDLVLWGKKLKFALSSLKSSLETHA